MTRDEAIRNLVKAAEDALDWMFHLDGCSALRGSKRCSCGRTKRWTALNRAVEAVHEGGD